MPNWLKEKHPKRFSRCIELKAQQVCFLLCFAALQVPISGAALREEMSQRQYNHNKKQKERKACHFHAMGCRLDRDSRCAVPWAFFAGRAPRGQVRSRTRGAAAASAHYARGHRNRRVVRVTEGRRRIINVFSERISALCFAAHFLIHYAPLARIGRALDTNAYIYIYGRSHNAPI